jgi:hypothetical protein
LTLTTEIGSFKKQSYKSHVISNCGIRNPISSPKLQTISIGTLISSWWIFGVKKPWELDVVANVCNPSTQEAKAEDHEFEASLNYIVGMYLKK